jgi:hypothetical protein
MAKFHGKIGFIKSEETSPGVYTDVVTEKDYKGDLLRNSLKWEFRDQQVNDDLNINNRFSIVADVYAYENIEFIKYITWQNVKWKIKSIDIQRPRLILHVGGVYHGN